MKKNATITMTLIIVGIYFYIPQASAVQYYSLGTASTAGTYYIIGAGFASHINKYYPKVKTTAEVSGGSVENYHLLKRKKMDFSLMDAEILLDDIRKNAFGGEAKDKVRILMWSYHSSDFHWLVRKGSPVKKMCDIKNKKVGVGPHGATALVYNLSIIKSICNYQPDKDFKALYNTFADNIRGIQDNTIDVGMVNAGFPVGSVMDIASNIDIDLISLTDEEINRVKEDNPLLLTVAIPAGTYKGVNHDIKTLGMTTGIICRPDLPEEDVYGILKALFTNAEERNIFHPQAKKYTLEATIDIGSRFAKMGMAFHPGSIKYLKEIGAWRPELEAK